MNHGLCLALALALTRRCIEASLERVKDSCPLCRAHVRKQDLVEAPLPTQTQAEADAGGGAGSAQQVGKRRKDGGGRLVSE